MPLQGTDVLPVKLKLANVLPAQLKLENEEAGRPQSSRRAADPRRNRIILFSWAVQPREAGGWGRSDVCEVPWGPEGGARVRGAAGEHRRPAPGGEAVRV